MLKSNEIYNLPCEEGLMQLDNESIDFVCIDPPYTDGKGNDVLNGHKIQTKLDILAITKEHYRVLKPNSFYAVFGQMPTILKWYEAALQSGFKYKIDIVWAKKKGGQGGNLQMKKSHELIYIFSKGEVNYYKTNGIYSDVSQGQTEFGIKDIESVYRQLNYWKGIAQGKKLINSSITGIPSDDYFYKEGGFKRNITQQLGNENVSFNTVWAFTTHNQKERNPEFGQVKHPSVKSIPCLERLIELCTPEKPEIIVLDSFIGSGTTYLACQNTNRKCIGFEIAEEYYLLSKNRAAKNVNLFTGLA